MNTYRVHLQTGAYTSVTVEAEDRQEAIEKAFNEGLPTICAQCSGWGQDYDLELGDEWDVPKNSDGSDADYAVEEVQP